MAIFDPLSRYRAESTAYQAIDLVPGTSGVVTISGLSSVANGSVAIDLGSNVFRFYGASFSGNNQLYVSENGLISFGGAESSPSNNNLFGYEAYRIAPLWDDWVTNRNTSVNDLVLYQFRDLNSDGTTDQLVIEWNNVYNNNVPESDGATFQVILSLNTGASNGDIVFNYVDLAVDGDSGDGNFNNGGSATIGIRSGQSGTVNTPLLVSVDGQQYNAFDQLVPSTFPVSSGSAIRISTLPNPSSPAPALVKDINTVRIGSNPSQLRVFNGALYVVADNGVSGDELLRIDASGASSLVRDVYPGPAGSGVRGLTVVGSNLFFLAFDDTNGYGVWKSDGTTAGTTLVRGGLSSITRDFNSATTVAASSGKFFFGGYDDTNGLELWVSDGTTAGTLRISNIEAGSGWSEPDNLTDVNSTLYFTATTSTGGRELYKSGGTAATTVLVRAIASGAPSSDPRELLNLNGTLYFTANDGASGRELWKSDGTTAGTVTVRNINTTAGTGSDPLNLTILGSTLYFFANSGSGYQLWKSDGTSAGTVRVSTSFFNADFWSNNSFNLTNINGTLYFSQQGATTTELWKSDGTTVTKVADLPSYFSFISGFTNVGGILYFNLGDGDASTGRELWKSDGTAAGTMLVRDVVPGTAGSNPSQLTAFNNKLYFAAASENAFRTEELWSSDGTAAGTVSLELDPRTVGSDISTPLLFNGKLYFAANDGVLGKELWTSDGTAAGTQLVKDVYAGETGSEIRALTEMGGNLYFFAADDTNGYGLWKSNGSGAGTTLVRTVDPWASFNSPIISAGNRIYFNNYSATAGWELWSSNGTAAGTALLRNINPGAADSDPVLVRNAVLGNTFFFTAFDPTNGRELWKTDGTTAGTSLVRNINPGAGDSNPDGLIVFNGALYFAASDPTYGRELWKTDGTTTSRVKNISPGAGGSNPQNFAVFQGSLYFTAVDDTGWQLWKTDGSTAGTVKVTNFNAWWHGPMAQLTAVNNTLFFTTNSGTELWRTDGTTAGTTMMSGAPWASLGSSAALSDLTNVNGVLYFAAFDATNGRELWRSDGTAEGTFRVTDLNPQAPLGSGLGNANPSNLIYDSSRNKLFFTASNWQSGGEGYGNNELFSLDVAPASSTPNITLALSPATVAEDGTSNLVYTFTRTGATSSPLTVSYTLGGSAILGTDYTGIDAAPATKTVTFLAGSATATITVDPTSDGVVETDETVELTLIAGSGYTIGTTATVTGIIRNDETRPIVDPLSRYRAESTAYQAIDLEAGAAGVVTISGLSSVADGSVAINLGSNVFRFYGASFSGNNQLYVSENGLISFGGAESSPSNNNLFGYEAYRIAPLWDDWVTNRNTSVNDLVLYQFRDLNSDGTADQLVIEWNNVYNYNVPESDGATFQAILSLNTGASYGDIVFNYVDLAVDGDSGDGNFNNGGSATIGIRSGQPTTVNTPLLVSADGQQYNAYDQLIPSTLPVSSGSAIRISTVPNPSSPAPALVKDINTLRIGSTPSQLRVMNGALYVVADNGFSGRGELLRIDASGASNLVRDVRVGPNGAEIRGLTVVGSNLFFLAFDDTNGYGVWKSDGTTVGTSLVRGGLSSITRDYNTATTVAASSGKFFFRGYDDTNGLELWVSDGTTAGTLRISNIEAGSGWSEPDNLTDVNGTLYFTATTSTGGRELYKSSGTAATTVLVRDIASGAPGSDPRELLNLNGTLYFTANDGVSGRELWKSGGTSATTSTVRNINTTAGVGSDPLNLTILGSTLYFFANSGSGYQLWKSDGTSAGTVTVSSSIFTADSFSNNSFNLFNLNGILYFSNQGDITTELWKSDGSSVSKVADLPSYSSYITGFTNVNGVLYFNLSDSIASIGRELWKSDGTAAGTMLVRDVVPGTASSNPLELTAFNNKLYFVAESENLYNTNELWSSDGTAAGTVSLELNPTTVGSDISTPLLFNGNLYFAANDGVLGKELWTSNGTSAGTQLVKDVRAGGNGSDVKAITEMGGNLYFFAYDDINGYGLWKSDGSSTGTTLIAALNGWSYSYSPIITAGNRIYFAANSVAGVELWSSNGTTAGTRIVRNINPGAANSDPGLWKNSVIGNTFFFTAYDPTNGRELWRTDGTTAGTSLVHNINPGAGDSNPDDLIVFNGALYFDAYDPSYGRELWKTDGTTTTRVKNINPGGNNSDPQSYAVFQGSLYFSAYDGSYWQLWKTDGSTAGTVKVTNFGHWWSGPMAQLTAVNNTLFFTTNSGSELWKTDGTTAGTSMMSGAPWASLGSSAALSDLTNVNGVLYFSATDANNGRELWRSDGSAEGTFRVADLNPQAPLGYGLGNANPSNLIYDATRSLLFFTASNFQSGGEYYGNNELFSLDVNNAPTDLTISASSVNENVAPSSFVAGFSTTDADLGNTFAYSLVAGSGDADNNAFTIANNQLRINASPNFETKNSYNIRVRTTDQSGGSFDKAFSIAINDLNEAPSDLALSPSNIDENVAPNSVVGAFSSSDQDAANTFTYSLVAGSGDTDNSAFTIAGNQLQINASPDFETKSTYDIRVRTTDQGGLSFEKVLSIGINNVNEAPTDLVFGGSATVNENAGPALVLGSLSSIDPDSPITPQTFAYSLVAGTGDSDNSAFSVIGDQLVLNPPADFETKSSYSLRLRSTDQGGLFTDKVLTIAVNNVNDAPTDLALSASSVNENVAANTVVGTFNSVDQDAGNTFTYSLVAGTGSTDNGAFNILGNQLRITASPNFEAKNSYSIRVRSTDQSGAFVEKVLPISILNVNESPTNISLSASSVAENVAAGTLVGTLSSTDPDAPLTPQSFSYRLVAGTGSTDNAALEIQENELRLRNSPDFELKSSYSIRVQTRDQGNLLFTKVFTITVTNQPEAPSDLALSANSINENVAANSVVGTFSSTDQDAGNTFSYSLVAGTGATDNSAFTIVGNQLRINASPDFETKNSYSIRVRTTDQGGLSFEKVLSIAVNNVNEAPTDLVFGGSGTVNENAGPALVLGSLSTIDPDSPTTPQTFAYSLVAGTGDSDNSAFSVVGNQLLLKASADFETKSSYSLRLRSTDQGGLFTEKVLSIGVNNLNDAPTDLALSASSVNENVAANTVVGTFNSVDQDAGNTFTYSLVAGTGSTDNGAFNILGNQLRITASPNFEVKNSYSIRVRSTDQSGAFVEKVLPISILNVNESPTNISLSASSVAENVAAGTLVGTLSSTDPDAPLTPQSFSYRLVAGTGSTDNAAFEIQENELRLRNSPDFELKSSYSIRVQTRDQGNRTFAKVFTISVSNVNEAPTSGTDFFTATTSVDTLQGLGGNDGFFVATGALNSGDSFDGGADVDQLTLSGGSSTQTLTIDLNQANQFVSLTNGPAFSTTPIFTGFEDVNLSGFAGAGVLVGNSEANRFTSSARKDILTGNAGADTFALNVLGHSLLNAFDEITDFTSIDRIDAPGAIAATLTTSSGNATSLSSSAIAAVLTTTAFTANSARAFTVTGQSGTFIALNDATAGFSSTTDAVLRLRDYTIGVANPITIL